MSGQIEENKYLYDNLKSETGLEILPNLGCAEPSSSTDIIYNAGFECWYDLDWPITVNAQSEATLAQPTSDNIRTGKQALKINVINGDGYGRVRVTNTAFYDDFLGGSIKTKCFCEV